MFRTISNPFTRLLPASKQIGNTEQHDTDIGRTYIC